MLSVNRLDPDFGWHLTTGKYILSHGIPAHDLFSYTAPSYRWIEHAWGNDVIVAGLYNLGGYNAAAIVFAGLWSLAVLIAGWKKPLWVMLIASIALLPYAGVRSIVWSALGLAVLLRLLSARAKKAQLAIPLVILLWANLHGSFIIGLAVILYYVLRRRDRRLGIILLIAVLATFVNPYGPRLYVEVWRTLTDRALRWQIREWRPLYIPVATWTYVVVWSAGFWLFNRTKLKNWLSLPVLLFAAALSSTRNWILFALSAMDDLENFGNRLKQLWPKHLSLGRGLVAGAMIAAVVLTLGYSLYNNLWPAQAREDSYPVAAVAYLTYNPCPGNLFNDFNYGGYLIWRLPGVPLYIDGRMPTWRDENGQRYVDRYLAIFNYSKKAREHCLALS